MKRRFLAAMTFLAMVGFCGCDEEEVANDYSQGSIAGTWSGTMVTTRFMGYAAEESDIVPFTMNITQTGEYIDVTFQANEYPGFFTGHYYYDIDRSIDFTTTADYTYYFMGNATYDERSMSGSWSVNIPNGGMSGTWQASR